MLIDCAEPLVFRYCADKPVFDHPAPDSVPQVLAAPTTHTPRVTVDGITVVVPVMVVVNGVDGAVNVPQKGATSNIQYFVATEGRKTSMVTVSAVAASPF